MKAYDSWLANVKEEYGEGYSGHCCANCGEYIPWTEGEHIGDEFVCDGCRKDYLEEKIMQLATWVDVLAYVNFECSEGMLDIGSFGEWLTPEEAKSALLAYLRKTWEVRNPKNGELLAIIDDVEEFAEWFGILDGDIRTEEERYEAI